MNIEITIRDTLTELSKNRFVAADTIYKKIFTEILKSNLKVMNYSSRSRIITF